jgi:hypothetical protein
MVQDQPRQKQVTLPEKQTNSKRTEGVPQMVEHLPSNGEALSSIPTKKKKKNPTKNGDLISTGRTGYRTSYQIKRLPLL